MPCSLDGLSSHPASPRLSPAGSLPGWSLGVAPAQVAGRRIQRGHVPLAEVHHAVSHRHVAYWRSASDLRASNARRLP